jgi:tagatose-6-phosphate ketose/aldose isomerase
MSNACLVLMPDATHDRGFAMTSSFSAMLLAGALAFGAIKPAAIARLSQSAATLLPEATALGERLVAGHYERVVYLGSNELRGLAAEAALKLLELTDGRVVAVADSTLGFRHGPKTIINDRTLVVVMLSNDPYTRAYDADLLKELDRDGRAGGILALAARPDHIGSVDRIIYSGMGDAPDLELAPLHAVVAQSFALLQSLALGLTPDHPDPAGRSTASCRA